MDGTLRRLARLRKAELHQHLDGSIPPRKTWGLMRRHGLAPVRTFAEMKKLLALQPSEERSLLAYLDKFHYPLWITQFYENIREVTAAIVVDASRRGVRLLELRYSPVIHTFAGMTLRQSIRSVLSGMNLARAHHPIDVGLVVIAMRQHGPHIAKILARQAIAEAEHLHERSGVVGFDIAGAEQGHPPRLFAEAYRIAAAGGLGLTAHAGEAASSDYVWQSVDDLGVRRIGHACSAVSDPALLRRLARDGILVECCITSNYQTGAVQRGSQHPIFRFLEAGIPVAVCTDNSTVSDTDQIRENRYLLEALGPEEIADLHRRAAEHSFIRRRRQFPPAEKERPKEKKRIHRAVLGLFGMTLAAALLASSAGLAAAPAVPAAPAEQPPQPPPGPAPPSTGPSASPPSGQGPAPGGQPSPLRRLPPELRGRGLSPAMSEREVPASEEDAEAKLRELLPLLRAASERHETYALRFTCDETFRTVPYDWQKNEATSENVKRFAYLLAFDQDRSRYNVIRQTLTKEGKPGGEETLQVPCPDAYAWTFLFSPRNQRVLHYRYLGREIKDYRLAHVVEFESSAPFVEGQDTREWSGTVWIEDRTFNFVRIEAIPSFQERRLTGQWRVYTESFNLPWGKARPRPRGYELTVEFNYSRDGMLFPTRVDVREFVWVARGREVTDRRFVQEYTDYRFFQTTTEETQKAPRASP